MDPELLPGYREICERFARLAKVTISNHARRIARITCTGLRRATLGEVADQFPGEEFITLFSLVERESPALFVFEQAPAYALITALLGGKPAPGERRETTASEIEVLTVVTRDLFLDLANAFAPYADVVLRWIRAECRFEFVAVVPATEPMLAATFRVEIGGVAGDLHVVAPSRTIFPLRDALI